MKQNHFFRNVKMRKLKVSFYLRSNYTTKRGKSPVMVRVSYDGQHIPLCSAGVDATPERWDKGFIGRSIEAIRGQAILDSLNKDILALFHDWAKTQKNIDLKKFRKFYQTQLCPGTGKKEKTIKDLFEAFMEREKDRLDSGVIRVATYKIERSTSNYFIQYFNDKQILVKEIDIELFEQVKVDLFRDNKKVSTINFYLQHLKTVCNFAVNQGWLASNPLRGAKILKITATLRYLTEEELKNIFLSRVDGQREVVRDIFEFMTLTSLALSDVLRLSPAHIKNENNRVIIRIQRLKTSVECVIPLLYRANEILDKYTKDRNAEDNRPIFPHFDNKNFNRHLGRIACIARVNKKVTSHMARHSFGSRAVSHGVHLSAVQKCMGHKSIKTTERYSTMQTDGLQKEIDKLESLTTYK